LLKWVSLKQEGTGWQKCCFPFPMSEIIKARSQKEALFHLVCTQNVKLGITTLSLILFTIAQSTPLTCKWGAATQTLVIFRNPVGGI
jgi:hypothetical protein